MPANASGSLSVVEEKPSSFTLATCSHRSTGGLSIETLPPGSNAPKKKLCHDMRHAAHGGVVEGVGRDPAEVDQPQQPPRPAVIAAIAAHSHLRIGPLIGGNASLIAQVAGEQTATARIRRGRVP